MFKFKQDAMWYDIGNKQANRKTSLLLETACRMGKPQDQKNGCHLEDEHELTPEVLEKLADISRSKLSSKQRVQELMKLLVIPPAIDPLAWELELQRKRRANSTTTTNATAFHHHPFPELVKSSSSPPNDIILLDDDIVSNDKRRVSKRKASLPDHHYRHPVKQPRFPSAVNCRRQSDYSRNDDSEPVPELVGSVL